MIVFALIFPKVFASVGLGFRKQGSDGRGSGIHSGRYFTIHRVVVLSCLLNNMGDSGYLSNASIFIYPILPLSLNLVFRRVGEGWEGIIVFFSD